MTGLWEGGREGKILEREQDSREGIDGARVCARAAGASFRVALPGRVYA